MNHTPTQETLRDKFFDYAQDSINPEHLERLLHIAKSHCSEEIESAFKSGLAYGERDGRNATRELILSARDVYNICVNRDLNIPVFELLKLKKALAKAEAGL